jgi:hypothetical protein
MATDISNDMPQANTQHVYRTVHSGIDKHLQHHVREKMDVGLTTKETQ